MSTTLPTALRVAAFALVLMFGTVTATSVSAQDASPVAAQVSDATEDDGGFDDWGLLGLRKRTEHHEVRTVDRPVTNRQ